MRTLGIFVAGAVCLLLVAALAGGGGYLYRAAQCDAAARAAEAEVSSALATLAEQYALADAKARGARRTREAEASDRVTGNSDAAAALPPRDCGLSADEHRLLADTYCAAFPGGPGCVSGALPDRPPAATSE